MLVSFYIVVVYELCILQYSVVSVYALSWRNLVDKHMGALITIMTTIIRQTFLPVSVFQMVEVLRFAVLCATHGEN